MTRTGTPGRGVRRLVAVILAMSATSVALVGVAPPAGAAACSSSSGVSVIVDFSGVASGLRSACVATGADRPADEVLTSAGFSLDWVQRQPGFLCRVDGAPASDPCVNTPPSNAYWGLFWSDGNDGVWHYSDFGVSGLQVPDGGYIGLAWQSGTRRDPGQAPAAHEVAPPSPTATPTATPTSSGPGPASPSAPSTSSTNRPRSTKPSGTTSPGPTKTPGTSPTSTSGPTETTQAQSPSPTESGSAASPSATPDSNAPPTKTPSPDATGSSAAAVPDENSSATPSPSAAPGATVYEGEPTAATTESRRVPTWLSVTILVLLLVSIVISAVAARRRTRV